MSKFCVAYITCHSRDEVESLCRNSVQERLAAAANYLPIRTFSWNDDEVEETGEWVALLHTREDLWPLLVDRLNAMSSDGKPCCIMKLEADAHFPYGMFINDQTQRFNEAHY